MAFDTVRTNKMRSGLTVLGVVIGITSIVGMTALIRGFDQSLRDMIRAIGPNTIFVQRFGVTSFASGAEISQLLKRPNLSLSDARALEDQSTTLEFVDLELGAGPGPITQQRIFYRDLKTKPLLVFGTSENFAAGTRIPIRRRPLLQRHRAAISPERRRARQHGLQAAVRAGRHRSDRQARARRHPAVRDRRRVRQTAGRRRLQPRPGRLRRHPVHAYQRVFGLRVGGLRFNGSAGTITNIQISVLPRDGVNQADAIAEVERIMRIRHGLRLDEPDDFDISTQDQFLQLWDRISQGTFFALIVISSIALMVGGIGVMAIMSISVTERTREIGVRKALGARRAEILFQFLMEAAFLTSAGGLLGIALGASIGWAVHLVSGFPISLPWWSFAIGLGFSAAVGIFFGMYPAIKASRLDPIEALRYE